MLCVQRTGWGKSAVYFLATALLRERGAGPTLIVSPLLALMRNQIAAAERLGIRAHTVNSTNREAWDEVRALLDGRRRRPAADQPRAAQQPAVPRPRCCRCSPSASGCWWSTRRTASPTGATTSGPTTGAWRTCSSACRTASAVLCTTATANDRVVADVEEQLRVDGAGRCAPTAGRSARSSLRFEVVELPGQADRLAWLATRLPAAAGLGDRLHAHQARRGAGRRLAERPAGSPPRPTAARSRASGASRSRSGCSRNEVKAVVATSALGMGYDKPDLGFVVHYQAPGSVIAYYQQVGRAGPRDRARRGRAAARRRGPPDPGLLHRAGVPAARARRPRARAAGDGGRDGRDRARADGDGQPRPRARSRRC